MQSKPIPIQLQCPNCGQSFEDAYAGIFRLSGEGFKADFEPAFVTHSPISELLLYQCDHCGFTERSILERFEKPLLDELKTFIDESLPNARKDLEKENQLCSSKFVNYALMLEHSGAREFDIGKAYLRASWIDDSDECRTRAFEYFEEAVSRKDVIGSAEAPFAAYLAGEMARKLGKFLSAERLYHVANKLGSKTPELAIRTYSFILEMAESQSNQPTDEPVWNFSEGLVLDPLDYYHAKLLSSIGVYYHNSHQQDAIELYDRAYTVCKPALERVISKQNPQIDFDYEKEYLTLHLARRSLKNFRNGLWPDSSLVMMGYQTLEELKKLKPVIRTREVIENVELGSAAYAAEMEEFEKEYRKLARNSTSQKAQKPYQGTNENRLNKVWNLITLVSLSLISIALASSLTYYGLTPLGVKINPFYLFSATSAVWLIWTAGQAIIISLAKLIARLFKREIDQHPIVKVVIPVLAFIGGIVVSILLASWPAIISALFAGVFLYASNLIVQWMARSRLASITGNK